MGADGLSAAAVASPASPRHWLPIRGGRPRIIAHRGASADAPENTMAAFRLAQKQGADGIELDVMRCGSGEVVVFHDDDLERLGGRPGWVRASSYDELRTIDLGGGERIPLLVDVLAELGPMLCNVELKTAPHWGGRIVADGLAGAVADILYRAALQERVLVSSFDPLLLARFRLHAPRVATGLLFAHDQARPYREAWAAPLLRPAAVHPEGALVDARAVAGWHARGFMVNVWTIDEPAEIRLLTALGVDGIITNRPAVTRSMIR